MSDRTTYRTALSIYLLKDTVLVDADRNQALKKGLEVYERRRPLRKTVSLTGSSTRKVKVPTDWVEKFSEILAIEYPLNQTPSNYIHPKYFRLKEEPDGIYIEFLDDYPGDSDSFYLTYTIRHTVNDSTSTVYGQDEELYLTISAAFAAEFLQANYSQTVDTELGADAVGFRDKAEKYASLARQHREEFNKKLPKRKVGAFADWEQGLQYRGGSIPFIFHNNR